MLLQTGNPLKESAAFQLLSAIIVQCPYYFSSSFDEILNSFTIHDDSHVLVKEGAVMLQVAMAKVDHTLVKLHFPDIYNNIEEVLLEFTPRVANCINDMVDYCPEFVNENIDRIKSFIKLLFANECFDELFSILSKHIVFNHCIPSM